MSDDWAVVEEALNLRMVIAGRPEGDVKMAEAQIALARLREREARLEEALREGGCQFYIVGAVGACQEQGEDNPCAACAALAHKEETP